MFGSLDLNLRQSEVTEGLKQQSSEVRRELYSTVCRIHIGCSTVQYVEYILEGSQKEQSQG